MIWRWLKRAFLIKNTSLVTQHMQSILYSLCSNEFSYLHVHRDTCVMWKLSADLMDTCPNVLTWKQVSSSLWLTIINLFPSSAYFIYFSFSSFWSWHLLWTFHPPSACQYTLTFTFITKFFLPASSSVTKLMVVYQWKWTLADQSDPQRVIQNVCLSRRWMMIKKWTL